MLTSFQFPSLFPQTLLLSFLSAANINLPFSQALRSDPLAVAPCVQPTNRIQQNTCQIEPTLSRSCPDFEFSFGFDSLFVQFFRLASGDVNTVHGGGEQGSRVIRVSDLETLITSRMGSSTQGFVSGNSSSLCSIFFKQTSLLLFFALKTPSVKPFLSLLCSVYYL